MAEGQITFKRTGLEIEHCQIKNQPHGDLHIEASECVWTARVNVDVKPQPDDKEKAILSFGFEMTCEHKNLQLQLMHVSVKSSFQVDRKVTPKAKLNTAIFLGNYASTNVQGVISDALLNSKLPYALPQMTEQFQPTGEFKKLIEEKWR